MKHNQLSRHLNSFYFTKETGIDNLTSMKTIYVYSYIQSIYRKIAEHIVVPHGGSVASQEKGIASTPSHTVAQPANSWSMFQGAPLTHITLNTNSCNYKS